MAYSLMQADSNVAHGVNQYVVDTPEDISKLPTICRPGSAALVVSTGDVYILNNEREWKNLE